MPPPYENITVKITRARAHELIQDLIDKPEFREEFETNTWEALQAAGIECRREDLPEEVRLPAPEDLDELLRLLNEKIVSPDASPFGFVLMVLAFGAMPVLIGDR